jgi:hypothetical protein
VRHPPPEVTGTVFAQPPAGERDPFIPQILELTRTAARLGSLDGARCGVFTPRRSGFESRSLKSE